MSPITPEGYERNRVPLSESPNHGESLKSTLSPNQGLFANLTKMFFGADQASPSPNHKSTLTTTDRPRLRKVDLKSRIPASRSTIRKRRTRPFYTELGTRKFPERIHPRRPDAKMIRDARRGLLTKFLEQGDIVLAKDYGEVNPQTAELRVDEYYDLETDHLSDEDEAMPDDQKTESNLYYIAVDKDELPSYHFWREPGQVDPLEARKPVDWGDVFARQLPEILAEEAKENLKAPPPKVTKAKAQSRTIDNDYMPGRKFHQEFNPKRSVRPGFGDPAVAKTDSGAGWTVQGSLAGMIWNTGNHGIIEGSRESGPQPGDAEWETAEGEWEARLKDAKDLRTFLAQYKTDENIKWAELTARHASMPLRPIPGDDLGTERYNGILKTAIPTVAFKLTQQQFGRPVSPLQGNEPLCRNEDPKNWKLVEESGESSLYAGGEPVYHEEEFLEFLDFYSQKSYGQPMLRSKSNFASTFYTDILLIPK